MSGRVLILRPEPGATATEERARAMGLATVKAPLFAVKGVAWEGPPPEELDALFLTSANALRHGGDGLAAYAALRCYAVGEPTAVAARAAGFGHVRAGPSDGAAMLALARGEGVRSALHLCGRHHVPLRDEAVSVTERVVYEAVAADRIAPRTVQALRDGAVALLHSPRAARLFAALLPLPRGSVAIAAISEAALAAAGEGWRASGAVAAPRDAALLELAAKLCQSADGSERRGA